MGSLTTVADLARLARRINAAHAAAERSFRAGLERARAAGALLAAAKARLGHGEWLPWLRANVAGPDVPGKATADYGRLGRPGLGPVPSGAGGLR
jgi:hypothetical protein